MQRIYYSRQNYNQLKRKQYEEYLRMQNRYYLHRKKYYEEYFRRQNRYYLYKKKQYEGYVKRQNRYYLYRKKYYEEYIRRQNRYYLYMKNNYEEYVEMLNRYNLNNRKYSEFDTSQSRLFNHLRVSNNEERYIIDKDIKSLYGYLDSNMEERNLHQYGHLENKNYPSIEAPYNEEYLEESDEKFIEENDNELKDEKDKEYIEDKNDDFIVETDNGLIEEKNKEFIEVSDKEFIEENNEEFLCENYNTSIKEELYKKSNISIEGIYVKFPVILAETSITITVEDTITLNQEVDEIKRIKKGVFLTESRLIPFSSNTVEPNSGILFIKGFIRNNIEYETEIDTEVDIENACGYIRDCTIEVPFNFTTRITFIRPPIFIENTITSELKFVNDSDKVYDIYSDSAIGCYPCEQCLMFTEVFNEKPFVELVKADIIEIHINTNETLNCTTQTEQIFTKVTEKVVLNLTIKILQKQQLRITAL